MQELSINPDKLHTTELGAERIKRNLNLQIDDIVLWCKESVKQADIIIRWGKNFYVYRSGVCTYSSYYVCTVFRGGICNERADE